MGAAEGGDADRSLPVVVCRENAGRRPGKEAGHFPLNNCLTSACVWDTPAACVADLPTIGDELRVSLQQVIEQIVVERKTAYRDWPWLSISKPSASAASIILRKNQTGGNLTTDRGG